MRARAVLRATFAIAALAAIGGCSAVPPPTAQASHGPTPATVTTAAPAAKAFALPLLCADQLPQSRIADFASRSLVLLGGPDGRYGLEYSADPSPEERVGGITCIWGYGDSELSAVTISVAPLTSGAFATVTSDLVGQGLNADLVEGTSRYWQEGDTVREPAILNVLRVDSWISVIESVGGADAFAEAQAIADEVFDTVYLAN